MKYAKTTEPRHSLLGNHQIDYSGSQIHDPFSVVLDDELDAMLCEFGICEIDVCYVPT